MPLITWSDEYSIGNAVLDNHHKKLIEVLNGLHDNINKDCNPVEHNKFIDNLLELNLSYKGSCIDAKQETVEFLWEWLMNHIINEDKKICR